MARAADSNLDAAVLNRIREVFESYAYVSALLKRKDLSLARLKRLLFADTKETSQNVLGVSRFVATQAAGPVAAAVDSNGVEPVSGAATTANASGANAGEVTNDAIAKTRPGDGRNGAHDLPGTKRVSRCGSLG